MGERNHNPSLGDLSVETSDVALDTVLNPFVQFAELIGSGRAGCSQAEASSADLFFKVCGFSIGARSCRATNKIIRTLLDSGDQSWP